MELQGGKAPAGTPNEAWLSLDLLLLLSQLYENGHAPAVHQILEVPKTQCPELLVLSTASALRCRFPLCSSAAQRLNSLCVGSVATTSTLAPGVCKECLYAGPPGLVTW